VGTTFEIYLPRFVEAEMPAAITETLAPPRGHNELILVADDDVAVRELLRLGLEDYGYRVITAANGAEAVSIFKQASHDVSLLISDQAMPVMDGFQATAAIRALRMDLPVLFLSGGGEARPIKSEESQPNIGHLNKPIELDVLLKAVSSVFGNLGESYSTRRR
jgi:two-component system, cell cycle sensor histidine kinase and response regulator CckA